MNNMNKLAKLFLLTAMLPLYEVFPSEGDDFLRDIRAHLPNKPYTLDNISSIASKSLGNFGNISVTDTALEAINNNIEFREFSHKLQVVSGANCNSLAWQEKIAKRSGLSDDLWTRNIRYDSLMTGILAHLISTKDLRLTKSPEAHYYLANISFYLAELINPHEKTKKTHLLSRYPPTTTTPQAPYHPKIGESLGMAITRDLFVLQELSKANLDVQETVRILEIIAKDFQLFEQASKIGDDTAEVTVDIVDKTTGRPIRDGYFEVWYVCKLFSHIQEEHRVYRTKTPIHKQDLPPGNYKMWARDHDKKQGEESEVGIEKSCSVELPKP